ncbi:MAG: hypothetical protein Q8L47_02405 [bacterium]|nr:hypothetical protein [bacterium]
MSTQVIIKKLNREVGDLKNDIREMREFLFTPLNDPEGEYEESFVKQMLLRAQGKKSLYKFAGKESFLKHVRSKK